ncbi:TIGR02680 family protein [Deinococcus grandis]|uniref:TIGR02680 family protein n=1 Tax=Deinococcus grandis TaxID=57498 RepID=A0A100HJE3_9DEIO|nr:hypothetical protein DEGR_15090 [Deinococcus grandis]GAQ21727.1 TIGR02680 family protein [Deinococcus grandis]
MLGRGREPREAYLAQPRLPVGAGCDGAPDHPPAPLPVLLARAEVVNPPRDTLDAALVEVRVDVARATGRLEEVGVERVAARAATPATTAPATLLVALFFPVFSLTLS